jgi:hypothetical protein
VKLFIFTNIVMKLYILLKFAPLQHYITERVHRNFNILGEMHQWEVNWGEKLSTAAGDEQPYI